MQQPDLAPGGPAPAQAITVSLTCAAAEAIYGESVLFRIEVANAPKGALAELPSLGLPNRVVWLEASAGTVVKRGGPASRFAREMKYSHGPEEPRTTAVPAGGKMSVSDDVVTWLGELDPGDWMLCAVYNDGEEKHRSGQVGLKIKPPAAVALATPRPGLRAADAPATMTWIHRLNMAEAGPYALFFQQRSQPLPRSAIHGYRAAVLQAPVDALAATAAYPTVPTGHVVLGGAEGLSLLTLDLSKPAPGTPARLKTPFPAMPLPSPLSTTDGRVYIPCCDAKRTRATVLTVMKDGALSARELALGDQSPLGPSAWLWEYEDRLHVVWAKAGSREFSYARLVLADPTEAFSTPQRVHLDDKIQWLDGYVEPTPPRTPGRPEDELEPPRAFAMVVCERPGKLACARVDLSTRFTMPVCSFATDDSGPLEVVNSVVTMNKDLAMILRHATGKLYYASTSTRSLVLLSAIAGAEITPESSPTLLAAGLTGVRPWVYVRYLEKSSGWVRYAKLEPADTPDPFVARPAPPPMSQETTGLDDH